MLNKVFMKAFPLVFSNEIVPLIIDDLEYLLDLAFWQVSVLPNAHEFKQVNLGRVFHVSVHERIRNPRGIHDVDGFICISLSELQKGKILISVNVAVCFNNN